MLIVTDMYSVVARATLPSSSWWAIIQLLSFHYRKNDRTNFTWFPILKRRSISGILFSAGQKAFFSCFTDVFMMASGSKGRLFVAGRLFTAPAPSARWQWPKITPHMAFDICGQDALQASWAFKPTGEVASDSGLWCKWQRCQTLRVTEVKVVSLFSITVWLMANHGSCLKDTVKVPDAIKIHHCFQANTATIFFLCTSSYIIYLSWDIFCWPKFLIIFLRVLCYISSTYHRL